jgi:hypothetical protein
MIIIFKKTTNIIKTMRHSQNAPSDTTKPYHQTTFAGEESIRNQIKLHVLCNFHNKHMYSFKRLHKYR